MPESTKTPLAEKLGYEAGTVAKVLNAPKHYQKLLAPLPEGVLFEEDRKKAVDLLHVFIMKVPELEQFSLWKKQMNRDGMIWISWPKKGGTVRSDISESMIRDAALENGLVDVKVCAVDDTWSGLKIVYRSSVR